MQIIFKKLPISRIWGEGGLNSRVRGHRSLKSFADRCALGAHSSEDTILVNDRERHLHSITALDSRSTRLSTKDRIEKMK